MVNKGSWVQIHYIALQPEDRSASLPEDTKKVPLEVWVKGRLNNDAKMGEIVEITTRTGRKEKGELIDVNPCYKHNFGEFVPELLEIGDGLRAILFGGDNK
ncbi:MAG: 2-amino-4-oxopentanoate thiolase subunit OrtA [Clostridia bacterium]